MAEREIGFGKKVDKYLRREDTILANTTSRICGLEGTKYRQSGFKRGFECAITTPVALVSVPTSFALGMAMKISDGGQMFFVQERVGEGGLPINLVKIRSMKEGSDIPELSLELAREFSEYPEDDPRTTELGKKLRVLDLEELPQFIQVVIGDLSLVDLRSAPQYGIDYLARSRKETFEGWQDAYLSGRPGILNLQTAMDGKSKDLRRRYHYDMLYARKASLGLDLYIIYKTACKMAGKARRIIADRR